MLLRRFSHHFRRQDWFAVVLDLLVVVLGIVIGLQASAWNQSRIDRRDEITYLVALDAGQIQNLTIDGYVTDHFNNRRFALYSPNGEGLPQAPATSPPPDSLAFLSAQSTRNRITTKYISSNTAKRELVKVEAKLVEVQQLLRERMQLVQGDGAD